MAWSDINAMMSQQTGTGGFAASGWGTVASAILGGVQGASAYQDSKKASKRSAQQGLNDTAYKAALTDWYSRKATAEKRAALSNYGQFSTMDQIMPGYKDTYTPTPLEALPDSRNYLAGDNKKTNKKNYKYMNTAAAAGQGSVTLPGG